MQKEFWIYQQRQSENAQWALYVVKEWIKGHPETITLDITIYSEDIDTLTHSRSKSGIGAVTLNGYVNAVLDELSDFTTVHSDDVSQLEREINRILLT